MATLTITIPDQLAEQAQAMGLLGEAPLVALLKEAVDRHRRTDELFGAADRLARLDLSPMTAEEVQAEIVGARADQRAGRP